MRTTLRRVWPLVMPLAMALGVASPARGESDPDRATAGGLPDKAGVRALDLLHPYWFTGPAGYDHAAALAAAEDLLRSTTLLPALPPGESLDAAAHDQPVPVRFDPQAIAPFAALTPTPGFTLEDLARNELPETGGYAGGDWPQAIQVCEREPTGFVARCVHARPVLLAEGLRWQTVRWRQEMVKAMLPLGYFQPWQSSVISAVTLEHLPEAPATPVPSSPPIDAAALRASATAEPQISAFSYPSFRMEALWGNAAQVLALYRHVLPDKRAEFQQRNALECQGDLCETTRQYSDRGCPYRSVWDSLSLANSKSFACRQWLRVRFDWPLDATGRPALRAVHAKVVDGAEPFGELPVLFRSGP